ncbi:MAG: hypothetical protein ACHQU0_00395 [Candidatus Paceibacteria bacterium]
MDPSVDVEEEKVAANFVDYLFRNDETAAVLKCHLQLEMEMDQLLTACLPHASEILKRSFLDKAQILYASGLIKEEIFQKIKTFNKVRNKFSHRYGYKLTPDDIDSLKEINKGRDVEIPEHFKDVPNIREMLLLAIAVSRLGGTMSVMRDLAIKNPMLVYQLSHIMTSGSPK